MRTLTVKIPERLERELSAATKRRGRSKSELVREALSAFLAQQETRAGGISALDLAGDLVGCISGPKDLSTHLKYLDGYGR